MRNRIESTIRYFGGKLPREAASAWDGYLAALIEWGLLSPNEHASLVALLPKDRYPRPADDPVMQILLGWKSSADAAGM
jgi:hypothetical protein